MKQSLLTLGLLIWFITAYSQNVGVGTSSPTQKLDVAGWLRLGDQNSSALPGNAGALRYHDNGKLQFHNGTQWVDLGGDHIRNQISGAQSADYWISGIGRASQIQLSNSNTVLTQGSGNVLRVASNYGYTEYGPQNTSWSHFSTDRARYYFNRGITVDEGLIGSYDEDLQLQTSGTTRITALNSNGNVGIGTSPGARLHVAGGGQILGTNGTSSNTRTLTILEDGISQINFGSYPGQWTSALQIQNNDNSDFIWISPLDGSNDARIMAAGSGLDIYTNGSSSNSGTYIGKFIANGSVGTFNLGTMSDPSVDQGNNWITWGYRSDNSPYYCIRTQYKAYGSHTYSRLQLNWHTGVEIGASSSYGGTRFFNNSPGVGATQIMSIGDGDNHVRVNNYLFAQYLNTSDNTVGSGVTGVMVKQGDNYLRTGNAASVLSYLGITAPTGDNLGNHSATTTLNMNNNAIVGIGRLEPYGVGGNSGQGGHAYAIFQESGDWVWPYPDLRIAYHTGIKLGANAGYNGIRFYNDYDMTGLVMAVNDGSTSGTNNVYMAGTLGIGQTNTSYRLSVAGDAYVNGGWVRVTGNQGLYFESYGGGLYMVDGTWIRTYGSKNFYHDAGSFRTDGQLEVGGGGSTLYVTNGGNLAYRSNVLFANTSGRVAINSTNPLTTFDVYGPSFLGVDPTYHVAAGTYIGYNPLVYPSINGYGYVGTSGQAWWQTWSYNYYAASQREKKRSITPVAGELSDYVMASIDNLQPYFYKFNEETDVMESGNESHYRPQMHIGLIVDESPDYLLDPSFKGIDVYGAASLAIAGVKHNRGEINKLKESINATTSHDFGMATMSGVELWIPFSENFKKSLSAESKPVITLTPDQFVQLIVSEKNADGFKVRASSSVSNLNIDWVAMANLKAPEKNLTADLPSSNISIPAALQNQLSVPAAEKQKLVEYWDNQLKNIQTRGKAE